MFYFNFCLFLCLIFKTATDLVYLLGFTIFERKKTKGTGCFYKSKVGIADRNREKLEVSIGRAAVKKMATFSPHFSSFFFLLFIVHHEFDGLICSFRDGFSSLSIESGGYAHQGSATVSYPSRDNI